jgi:hypothetical protein
VAPPARRQEAPVAPVREQPIPAGRLRLTPDMGRSRDGRAA